jgi:hypothetical protein
MQHPPFSILEPLLLYDKDGYQVTIKRKSRFHWLSNREEHWQPSVYTVTFAVEAKANKYNTLRYSFVLSAKDMELIPSSRQLSEKNQTAVITQITQRAGTVDRKNVVRVYSTKEDPDLYNFIRKEGHTPVVLPRFLFACIQESVARIVKYFRQKVTTTTMEVVYKGVSERLSLEEFVSMAYAHGVLRQMYCNFLRERGMECGEFVLDYPSVADMPREMYLFLSSDFFEGFMRDPTETLNLLQSASLEYLRASAERTLRECAKKAELDIYILHGVDPVAKYWEIWQYMQQLTARLRGMFVHTTEEDELPGINSPMISIMRTVDLNNLCRCFWESDGEVFYTELYTHGEYGENPAMYVSLDWGH